MQIKDDLSKHLYLNISKKEIQAQIEQNSLADNQNVSLNSNGNNATLLEKKKRKQKDEKKHDPYKDKKKLELIKTGDSKEDQKSDLITAEVTLKKLNAI